MSPAQILFGLLALSALALFVWFVFEYVLLKRGLHPITWYERSWANAHAFAAAIVWLVFCFTAGIGVTHFFLDAPCQPFGR